MPYEEGEQTKATASRIWVPSSALQTRKVYTCYVAGCGREFPEDHRPQYERHLKACLKRNMDAIEAHVASRRDPDHGGTVFSGVSLDPERKAYERARGAGKVVR